MAERKAVAATGVAAATEGNMSITTRTTPFVCRGVKWSKVAPRDHPGKQVHPQRHHRLCLRTKK